MLACQMEWQNHLRQGLNPVVGHRARRGVEHDSGGRRQRVVAGLLHHADDVDVQARLVDKTLLEVDPRELAVSHEAETS